MDSSSKKRQNSTPAYIRAPNGTIYSPDVDGAYRNGNGGQLNEHVQQVILAGGSHSDYVAHNDDGSLYVATPAPNKGLEEFPSGTGFFETFHG